MLNEFLWPLHFGHFRMLVFGLYKDNNSHGLEGWAPTNRFNHINKIAETTRADRPKSVHNRCEIEVLVTFCVVTFLNFMVWLRITDEGSVPEISSYGPYY